MEYTKGKWYWEDDDSGRPHNLRARIDDRVSYHILFLGLDFAGNYAFREAQANANLIASAPDMYEALKETRTALHNQYRYESDEGMRLHLKGVINQTTNALAKAEGRITS